MEERRSKDSKADARKAFNRLVPTLMMGGDSPSDIYSVKFSTDEQMIAAGYGDGSVKIFNTVTGKSITTLTSITKSMNLPVPALRFRPSFNTEKTRNVILAGYSEGLICHWHATSGKCLHTIREEGNQVFCLDYRSDGEKFCSAGKDGIVRVYDESTKKVELSLSGGVNEGIAGHSNRIFSLKYHPMDNNIILSGGWDNTIQFWDMRAKHSIRSIFGPHVCGDAIDVDGNEILAGSWRTNETLQVFDFLSGRVLREFDWKQQPTDGTTLLYTAQFSPRNGDYVAAGGSGSNEAKLFDRRSGMVVGRTQIMAGSIYCLDFDPEAKRLVVAGGFGNISMFDVKLPPSSKD
eukprot:TRINITY_DN9346_c0_g1_i1.p1 TRINITY_DN9346_c0_g1~~TRINITY_DN9346_c0_g1_i1.p1  ORF type:complete len:348 (+),score=62.37 TRINITY_DN9346_c0_g1_i1:52-1095(+)